MITGIAGAARVAADVRREISDRRGLVNALSDVAQFSLALGRTAPVPVERCPYLGLQAFDEGDAERFFGRAGSGGVASVGTWSVSLIESWRGLAGIRPERR